MAHFPQIKALQEWHGDDAAFAALQVNPGYRTVTAAGQYDVQDADRTILIDYSAIPDGGDVAVITIMLPHAGDHIGRIVNVTLVGINNTDFASVTSLDGDVAGNNDFTSLANVGTGGILLAAATGLWVAIGTSF